VVYGRPAIAVPVSQVLAHATVLARPDAAAGQVLLHAPQIDLITPLDQLPVEHPLRLAVDGVREALELNQLPALELRIHSTIPIASGLGSGAAVTVAIVRALSAFLGQPLDNQRVNAIAFRVDQAYHGTPSGIDNTVITYAQPIYFRRGQPIEALELGAPLTFAIGDSGQPSPTHQVVGDVRQHWRADPARYEAFFDQIELVTQQARGAIARGDQEAIGVEMTHNQRLLTQLGASSPRLDQLVQAALAAGALGAKLCGAGRGGNMIALVKPDTAEGVAQTLRNAGATQVIVTRVS